MSRFCAATTKATKQWFLYPQSAKRNHYDGYSVLLILVLKPIPDVEKQITIDASGNGWGAHCNNVTTHGLWTAYEKMLHNDPELKAVMFAVQALVT